MKNTKLVRSIVLIAGMLAIPATFAATMSKDAYSDSKSKISADYKTNRAACDTQAGNGKDVCVEEAKGTEKVARAELEFSYSGKASDHNKALVAKAEAAYAVAKEKCNDRAGNTKDVCIKEAKAAKGKALADAKMGKEISEARKDAASSRTDADYGVAAEKCDALAGDSKSNCIAAAKAKYGKT